MNDTSSESHHPIADRIGRVQEVWNRFRTWAARVEELDNEFFGALGRKIKELEPPPFGRIVSESDLNGARKAVEWAVVNELIGEFGLENMDRDKIRSEVDRAIAEAGGELDVEVILKTMQDQAARRRLESERTIVRAAAHLVPGNGRGIDEILGGKRLTLRFFCDRDWEGKPRAPYSHEFWEGLTALGKISDVVLRGTAPERARDICLFTGLIRKQENSHGPFIARYESGPVSIRPYANGRLDVEFPTHQAARDAARFICRHATEMTSPLFAGL